MAVLLGRLVILPLLLALPVIAREKCKWDTRRDEYLLCNVRCPLVVEDCRDGLKRHCGLNNTGHLTSACAHPTKCTSGTQPIILGDRIQCRICEGDTFYPKDQDSNMYTSCTQKYQCGHCELENKRDCLLNSVVCDNGNLTTDRTCRCDARRNYVLKNFLASTHYTTCGNRNDFTMAWYSCIYKKCDNPATHERLLNYSCAARCQQGYHRGPDSDDCLLDENGNLSSTESPTAKSKTSPTSPTDHDVKSSTTVEPTSTKGLTIGAIVGIVVAVVFAIIVVVCIYRKRKRIKDTCCPDTKLPVPRPVGEARTGRTALSSTSVLDEQTLKRKPTDKELGRIANYIGANYKKVALELGISSDSIDTIVHDNQGAFDRALKVLKLWRKRECEEATYNNLLKRLSICEISLEGFRNTIIEAVPVDRVESFAASSPARSTSSSVQTESPVGTSMTPGALDQVGEYTITEEPSETSPFLQQPTSPSTTN